MSKKYTVSFPEVRHPETGKLVKRGEPFVVKTDRGKHQAEILFRVGRLGKFTAAPVRKVAETIPPSPTSSTDTTAGKARTFARYQTRRLKAEE